MGEISAVIGQAGTGKTTWLMQKATQLAPRFLTSDHDRLLAITRMHGSRRRLHAKLRESSEMIPSSITTLDGFALSLVNRWRRSLGFSKPIQPVDGGEAFAETIFGTEAGFAAIMAAATRLLASGTVQDVVRESYPLIMVDEFQDCHGPLLDFIKALSQCSALIVAADDFQLLDRNVTGCPAVEWLEDQATCDGANLTRLAVCHRTSAKGILAAAKCLREDSPAGSETIPVFCCPGPGQAAYKIIEALVFKWKSWSGITAIISPSRDKYLQKVFESIDSQLSRRKLIPICCIHECGADEDRERFCRCLGLTAASSSSMLWTAPAGVVDPAPTQIAARALRYCRLRGIPETPQVVVARQIEKAVHDRRAYCRSSPSRVCTTVHGAKNREFDNVIVIWPYKVIDDSEQKRRLLYNAITRSKRNCMVLVSRDLKLTQADSVLSLLGPAKEPFSKAASKNDPQGGLEL